MLAFVLFAIQRFLRDLVRLGREGMPWIWMLILVGAVSGTGYVLAGDWGLLVGLPVLPPFGIGRWLAKRQIKARARESA